MEEYEVKLRKYNQNIEIGGAAIIIFGLWSVFKLVIQISLGMIDLLEGITVAEADKPLVDIVIFFIAFIFAISIILFHFLVGRGAIRYSRGRKNKRGFVFWCWIMLIITIISILQYPAAFKGETEIETLIASFFVDLTMAYSIFDILFSYGHEKRLRKRMDKGA